MESATSPGVPSVEAPAGIEALAGQLASLSYYRQARAAKKKSPPAWEALTDDVREPLLVEARATLVALDQLNLRVVPKVTKPAMSDQEVHELMVRIIKEFLSGVKVWKKELFLHSDTVSELAWRILHGGRA